MNTDALAALRGMRDKQEIKKAANAWAPPARGDLARGRILAFDQSLAACGVVVLVSDETGLTIRNAHVMQVPPTDAKRGREHMLRRGLLLLDAITDWYGREVEGDSWDVVYEAVPEGGSIRSPESSLLGAMAVLMASRSFRGTTRLLEPVPAQSHKRFICGNRNASKTEHHAALMKWGVDLGVAGLEQLTNEGKRDAFSVGVYALAHSVR
jgi:hypothetical protein